ncbi:MAG: transposase [Planctomycetota bacterium]|nr:transposase [Planctomycetota bacterium]
MLRSLTCQASPLVISGTVSHAQQIIEEIWLGKRLQQLIVFRVSHEKALKLQKRMLKHQHEWRVFLDHPRVPPTNNMAERAQRRLVVVRKITFGHRSEAGAIRMACLMTVAETAKRHGHRPNDIDYRLFTKP